MERTLFLLVILVSLVPLAFSLDCDEISKDAVLSEGMLDCHENDFGIAPNSAKRLKETFSNTAPTASLVLLLNGSSGTTLGTPYIHNPESFNASGICSDLENTTLQGSFVFYLNGTGIAEFTTYDWIANETGYSNSSLSGFSKYKYRREVYCYNPVNVSFYDYPCMVIWDHGTEVTEGRSRSDGLDIALIDSTSTTELDFEIENNTQNTAYTTIFFRLPEINGLENVTGYIYYGLTAGEATDNSNRVGVWKAFDDVWHFAETSGTTAYSSTNGLNLTKYGTVDPSTSNCFGGRCFNFINGGYYASLPGGTTDRYYMPVNLSTGCFFRTTKSGTIQPIINIHMVTREDAVWGMCTWYDDYHTAYFQPPIFGQPFALNQLALYAFNRVGTYVRLSINGTGTSSGNGAYNTGSGPAPLFGIGKSPVEGFNQFWPQGTIDECFIVVGEKASRITQEFFFSYSQQKTGVGLLEDNMKTFLKSDSLNVGLTCFDGELWGEETNSTAITINNTAPSVTVPSINDTAPGKNDILFCINGSYNDADSDAIGIEYWRWWHNGNEIQGRTSQHLNLADVGVSESDLINCSYKAEDSGYDLKNSTEMFSTGAVIQNFPPILQQVENQSVNENETLVIQFFATDRDNDTLTYYTNAAGVLNSPFFFDEAAGLFEWTPTFDDSEEYNVTFGVTDGALYDEAYVIIDVMNVNRAPSVTSNPETETVENSLYTYQVIGNDPDGDYLTYFLIQNPDGMTIENLTGIIQWTPTYSQAGFYQVAVAVTDSDLFGTQNYTLQVHNLPVCGETVFEDTVLRGDVSECPGNGLVIGSDNIVLDCNGHQIGGTTGFRKLGNTSLYDNYNGIYAYMKRNFTVMNCRVSGFERGVYLVGVSKSSISGNNITSNVLIGVLLDQSYQNEFSHNKLLDNTYGMQLTSTSIRNTVWFNFFNNSVYNAYEDETSNLNDWNSSVAGNYWSDFNGTITTYFIPGPGDGVDRLPFCRDATLPNQCSTTKPFLCREGVLISNCSVCGCPPSRPICRPDGICRSGGGKPPLPAVVYDGGNDGP